MQLVQVRRALEQLAHTREVWELLAHTLEVWEQLVWVQRGQKSEHVALGERVPEELELDQLIGDQNYHQHHSRQDQMEHRLQEDQVRIQAYLGHLEHS